MQVVLVLKILLQNFSISAEHFKITSYLILENFDIAVRNILSLYSSEEQFQECFVLQFVTCLFISKPFPKFFLT